MRLVSIIFGLMFISSLAYADDCVDAKKAASEIDFASLDARLAAATASGQANSSHLESSLTKLKSLAEQIQKIPSGHFLCRVYKTEFQTTFKHLNELLPNI